MGIKSHFQLGARTLSDTKNSHTLANTQYCLRAPALTMHPKPVLFQTLSALYCTSLHLLCACTANTLVTGGCTAYICTYTVHTLEVHCNQTAITLQKHCINTLHTLHIHSINTALTLHLHCKCTATTVQSHCIINTHTLQKHYINRDQIQQIYCKIYVFKLSMHCKYNATTLQSHCKRTV